MFLSDEDAKKFYDLWIPLLDFVNRKYKIKKKFIRHDFATRAAAGRGCKDFRKALGKPGVIDEYIASVAEKMEDEDKAMISGWKHAVGGSFVVERHLNKGSVLTIRRGCPKGLYC